MGTISITLPTLGDPNATEDVDLRNALSTIQTVINGNIDSSNITDASIQISDLLPKIVYGTVNGTTGAILNAGSGGWTSSKGSAGQYTITFAPAFSSIPILIATQQITVTSASTVTAKTVSLFTISCYTLAGAGLDCNVDFIAIGAR